MTTDVGTRPVDVLLADDQTLVRQGIRGLLSLGSEIRVVGEASDGDEALALVRNVPADVLLLDVRMPKKTGLQVLSGMRELEAAGRALPRVILLTTFDDDDVAAEGAALGASGFLLKDVSLAQLTSAIRTVAGGGTLVGPTLPPRVTKGLSRIAPDFPSAAAPESLTKRERDVLRAMAKGASNREIAEALGAAEGTIKNHASAIFQKLGVRDRTRAVLKALELGLI